MKWLLEINSAKSKKLMKAVIKEISRAHIDH